MTTQTIDVRVVRLEPLRVASVPGFGPSPEAQAWEKLMAWARAQGLADKLKAHRFFGFNNPSPAPGSPNYGYEQWMTVAPEATAAEGVTIKDFAGGLYAVLHCSEVPNPQVWGQLVQWREASAYHSAAHQWLEELLTPDIPFEAGWKFDLYLPIRE
jgi:DNA gyrase inhibitor GyrI